MATPGRRIRVSEAVSLAKFTKVVWMRFFRTPGEELVPSYIRLDVWAYCTAG